MIFDAAKVGHDWRVERNLSLFKPSEGGLQFRHNILLGLDERWVIQGHSHSSHIIFHVL